MTYTTPEVVALTHATEAIQALAKDPYFDPDSTQANKITVSAYEADE